MEPKKDVRFSEKKIDAEWKDQVTIDNAGKVPPSQTQAPATSKGFLNLIQSLGVQALMHLGTVPDPVSQQTEVNLEAAKETIDILIVLREKTSGNLSAQEKQLLDGLLSELQIKFSQSV